MSSWSRTTKPSADKTVPADQIFGVDANEARATSGVANPGWVRRKELPNGRVQYEVLAAMKTGPVEDNADDTFFGDYIIQFTLDTPATLEVEAPDPVVLEVATATVPLGGTVAYQWQVSTDDGENWSNLSNGGNVSGATTVELTLADSTGLDGNQYRCSATIADSGVTETSTPTVLSVI